VRLLLAVPVVALFVCGLTVATGPAARSVPGVCPPICDGIPDAAWMAPTSIPLFPVYRWPGLAGLAVSATLPRFAFEGLCASPINGEDPRDFAVSALAVVTNPIGQWELQAQVLHWRGDTVRGGPTALVVLETARSKLRNCQMTAPLASPSLTTDGPQQIAAVISVAGQRVMHQYLVADPDNSTIVELAMWSTLPPAVPWAAVPDAAVLDAMAAPLCEAYLGSCR
jgi:hypothetical protein